MREAVSDSLIMSIVITIIGACIIVVLASLTYSKTFKCKNRIIEEIEKYGTYSESNPNVKESIDAALHDMGYQTIGRSDVKCPTGRKANAPGVSDEDSGGTAINRLDKYKYCIYRYNTATGYYYSVATFISIDLPIIGEFLRLEIPVYGDTKIFINF